MLGTGVEGVRGPRQHEVRARGSAAASGMTTSDGEDTNGTCGHHDTVLPAVAPPPVERPACESRGRRSIQTRLRRARPLDAAQHGRSAVTNTSPTCSAWGCARSPSRNRISVRCPSGRRGRSGAEIGEYAFGELFSVLCAHGEQPQRGHEPVEGMMGNSRSDVAPILARTTAAVPSPVSASSHGPRRAPGRCRSRGRAVAIPEVVIVLPLADRSSPRTLTGQTAGKILAKPRATESNSDAARPNRGGDEP